MEETSNMPKCVNCDLTCAFSVSTMDATVYACNTHLSDAVHILLPQGAGTVTVEPVTPGDF